MSSISNAQFNEWFNRTERNAGRVPQPSEPVEIESELHQQISDYCRMNGWKCFHGSMAHKTKRTLGEPDFTIAADNGITIFIEAKAGRNKATPKQLETIAHLKKLGHAAGIAFCMDDVLDLIATAQSRTI